MLVVVLVELLARAPVQARQLLALLLLRVARLLLALGALQGQVVELLARALLQASERLRAAKTKAPEP